MSDHTTETADFQRWLRGLNFLQFMRVFGILWNQALKSYIPWNFWPGVRGYHGQRDMLEAMIWARILWIAKARQLAASEAAGSYSIFTCLKEPKALCMWFSKDSTSAEAALDERIARKLEGMLSLKQPNGKPWPWLGLNGRPVFWVTDKDGKVPKKIIEFAEGSKIEAHSSDDSGAASRTPRLSVFDEIRYYIFNDAKKMWASIVGTGLRPPAQLFGISTAESGSWFNQMTDEIMKEKVKSITFIFMPADIELCLDGTPRWTEAYKKAKLEEYFGDEVMMKIMHPLNPKDMFSSNEGLVISSLGPRHWQIMELPWQRHEEFYIVYDYGVTQAHPMVALFCRYDPYVDHLHVFDEVFLRGMDIPPFSEVLKERLKIWQKRFKMPAPYAMGDVRGRLGATKTIADVLLEETGLFWNSAVKYDKGASLELMKQRFWYGKITIDPNLCWATKKQFENWRYQQGKNDPDEKEDDSPDCVRYICYHLNDREPPTPPTWQELQFDRVREWKRGMIATEVAPKANLETAWMDAGLG